MNDGFTIPVVVIALSVIFAFFERRFEQKFARWSRLEAKVDAIMKHSGVVFDPYAELPASAVDALRRGRKIEAVMLYRQATGAGLKAAKEAIDIAVVHASSKA